MSLFVYLDSQDYSNLSDNRELFDKLIDLKESGQATFVYSLPLISECAPVIPSATKFAVRRAENIVALCGRNTFLSVDRIIEMELSALGKHAPERADVISNNGDWFPQVGPLFDPIDRRKAFEEVLVEKSLNRKQRRMVRSQAMRGTTFRAEASQSILAGTQETLTEVIRSYPMKPENASLVLKYIAGAATRSQAEKAMIESFRDPYWMMQWFDQHSDKLEFVSSFIRAPSKKVLTKVLETVELSKTLDVFSDRAWREMFDQLILEQGKKRLAQQASNSAPTLEEMHRSCPGIVTSFHTMRDFIRDSMGKSNRTLKESDFADAMHSLHAPYVDIFRTDRYMAEKIARRSDASTPVVCAKLSDLPTTIKTLAGASNNSFKPTPLRGVGKAS